MFANLSDSEVRQMDESLVDGVDEGSGDGGSESCVKEFDTISDAVEVDCECCCAVR